MITVSLEMAKKLKDAGFPQESFTTWVVEQGSESVLCFDSKPKDFHFNCSYGVSAPTMQEIWELLPPKLPEGFLNMEVSDNKTIIHYTNVRETLWFCGAENAISAVSNAWFRLKSEGHIK